VVSFTARPLYPQGKSPWYPSDRRLGGPRCRYRRSGEEKNSQPPPGIEPYIPNRPARNPALYRLSYHGSYGSKAWVFKEKDTERHKTKQHKCCFCHPYWVLHKRNADIRNVISETESYQKNQLQNTCRMKINILTKQELGYKPLV
jgi:hypothetical protein